jgi:hypothetical protein
MAMKKKKSGAKQPRKVLSLIVDWAIIDREHGKAIGVMNPEGKSSILRRVAIRAAIDNKLTYQNIRLVPVDLLTPEEIEKFDIANAPVLLDPKGKSKNVVAQVSAAEDIADAE